MSNARQEIITELNALDLSTPYKREAAETLLNLIISSYDHFIESQDGEPLQHWQMVKLAQAFSHLNSRWLAAAANCVGLSFETNVSVDSWHIQKLEQEYKEIESHLEGAMNSIRGAGERDFILERYADNSDQETGVA